MVEEVLFNNGRVLIKLSRKFLKNNEKLLHRIFETVCAQLFFGLSSYFAHHFKALSKTHVGH